ncbi:sensor histidine kinase [Rubripirellula obstinata]|nr:HAMP domain-containing sensor histidine kinase [Rubripirellula obstinata]
MKTFDESKSIRASRSNRSQSTGSSASGDNQISSVVRLMSETAHDLRSPLTTVREAIRLVHDGDLGEVTAEQTDLLKTAIDQCDCIDQMVGEMMQMERLRVGAPRADRKWVSIDQIRATVDQTLSPWSTPHQIDVLWDADLRHGSSSMPNVYADPSMIRRLIVNLVVNAIRASDQGQEVLIRFATADNGDFVRCSVIDRGRGIQADDLKRIADHHVSFSGGEGLGMTICRQLAAVHFSSLHLRSKLGQGTEVSFELPAAGPRSVAIAWARWRDAMKKISNESNARPLVRPRRRDETRSIASPHQAEINQQGSVQAIRLDSPAESVRSCSVALHHRDTKPRVADCFAAGIVTLGAAVSKQMADEFGDVLNRELQMFDMNYRVDARRWVWVLDADQNNINSRIDSIEQATHSRLEGVRSTWSEPQIISVDSKSSMPRLSDLMVRQALSASTIDHGLGHDEVRLGTSPISESDTANQRLDQELRRLSQQMKAQTLRLKQQSQNLRPRG